MKNTYITLLAAVAAVTIASCDKQDTGIQHETDSTDRVAVRFTAATLDVQPASSTRATTAWTLGGEIGIYALAEGSEAVQNGYANVGYTFSGSAFAPTAAAGTIYFPVDDTKYCFAAYSPRKEVTNATYEVDLTDQPTLAKQSASELLWTGITSAYDKTTPTVELTFDHQYASLSVLLKAGAGISAEDLGKIEVAVTKMHLKAGFHLLTGAMTATDPATDQTLASEPDNATQRYALLLPTAADGDRTMNFTLGDDVFRWEIGEKRFEAGKTYEYTVTVSRTPLGLLASVTDWEEGDSGAGEAK